MSKSLGNFTSLSDLLARTDGRAYRLLVLRSHYRSPIEVTPRTIGDAEEALARLDAVARRFALQGAAPVGLDQAAAAGVDADALDRFVTAMDDDLDTPKALAEVFELVRRANAAADGGEVAAGAALARSAQVLAGALGLVVAAADEEVDPESADLVRRRDAARADKDWALADRLRDELVARGWVVEDGPDGTSLRR
jgi:cysteinyl-tRNA synthetase